MVETWVPGTSVADYILIRELARGGMGEIWLARQTAGFERLVVLKRIIHAGDDPSAMAMFLDESRIASQLQHPNIVHMFELNQEGTSTFLVMEYLEGQTVSAFARRMVRDSGRVPAGLAVAIISGAARGLGYAHRYTGLDGRPLHIVHRDVSPQNVFLTYQGEVKVLDFGIALAAGRLAPQTSTGLVRGKIAYASPEQISGAPISGAADVFALGVILFELVTGTRLYRDQDDMAVMSGLLMRVPRPRASTRVPVEAELDALIGRALDIDPENRFADAQALFEELEAWQRRHALAPDEPTLQQAMASLFSEEIRVRIRPSAPSLNRSMPNMALRAEAPPRRARRFVLGLSVVALMLASARMAFLLRTPHQTIPEVHDAQATSSPAAVARPAPPVDLPAPKPAQVASETPTVAPPDAGPRAPPQMGLVTLDTDPWTRVVLGKRTLGVTPLVDVPLPAGIHRLRLLNEDEQIDTVIELTIEPGTKTVKKLAL